MRTLSLASVVIVLAVSAPAHAQIYKWVDEAGKTHYSDAAPVGGKASTIADKVSYYTPDPTIVARARAPSVNPVLADRVDRLEQQLHAERLARQQIELAAYNQPPEIVYVPVGVAPVRQHRGDAFRRFPGTKPVGVVGPGIMPGTFNGPNAITAGNATLRTSLSAPRGRGAAAF